MWFICQMIHMKCWSLFSCKKKNEEKTKKNEEKKKKKKKKIINRIYAGNYAV